MTTMTKRPQHEYIEAVTMGELLRQYRLTNRQVELDIERWKMYKESGQVDIEECERVLNILGEIRQDVQYAITWMSKGRNPSEMRGNDRLSVYQNTIFCDEQTLNRYYVERDKISSILERLQYGVPTSELAERLPARYQQFIDVELTIKQREVLMMTMEGMKAIDIAEALGMSKSYVCNIVTTIKKKFRKHFPELVERFI